MGNQKPPRLLEVEVIVWKALFAVARGEIDAEMALIRVMENIPWAKLDTIDDPERFWFKPGKVYSSFSGPLPTFWAFSQMLNWHARMWTCAFPTLTGRSRLAGL